MRSPTPPNPYQTADAQQRSDTGAGITQSILGNPNTFTPYGSQTYSVAGYEQIPGANGQMLTVPRYNMTQSLSPDQQKLLGLSTQTQYNMGQTAVEQSSKLREHLGKGVDTSKLQAWNAGPKAPTLATGFADVGGPQRTIGNQEVRQDQGATDRAAVEQAMMGRFNTDQAQQNQAQDAQLAARGMNPGGQGYGQVQQSRDRARTDATQQAYLASGQESRAMQDAYNQAAAQRFQQEGAMGQFANSAQQQAYAQALQRAGFSNDAIQQMFAMQGQTADRSNALRGTQFQELMALRNQPINEISALLAGGQVTLPQFQGYQSQGINAAPIGQYIGNNFAQQSANTNAFNSGLFGIAGMGGQMAGKAIGMG